MTPIAAAGVLVGLGFAIDPAVGAVFTALGYLGVFVFIIWNSGYKQGTTGQSLGKAVVNTRLVGAETGRPIGFGPAFMRQVAHVFDTYALFLGWLWPIWDERGQTFADKLMHTVVVHTDR